MKKNLILLILPALIYADNLSTILDFAVNNNKIIKSKQYTSKSNIELKKSIESKYYPTLDIGGSYESLNKKTPNMAGDTFKAYAKIGIDLYDSGEKSNKIKELNATYNSSKFDTLNYKKSLQFLIVEDFFNIKSTEAYLLALEEKKVQLAAELDRVEKFYEVGSATKDDIDKLKAEYENNNFQLQSVNHDILSLKKLFALKVGKEINSFEKSEILEPNKIKTQKSDYISSLEENSKSLTYKSKSLNSQYLPKLRLEDSFSVYDYARDDISHPEGLDNQNRLMLTLNMKLFDNGSIKKEKNSILLQKKALNEEIENEKIKQNINIKLAKSKINTVKAQIKSARNSLQSASSAFETIKKKFSVGAVDNVAYLDALSTLINTKAQYKTALNNLQVAYSNYYFYSNKNIREYIK